MLLILYREYVARMNERPDIKHLTFNYATWLQAVTEEAFSEGLSMGDFIRVSIDPTYAGA